jgi:hypothetical protein
MLLGRSTTLVVLTRDRLIRADFGSAGDAAPRALSIRERPHIDDPATLVEMALTAEKRKPGRVFVLSSDVWTHTLSMATATLHGMSQPELLQALSFEAEPLSGLSAFESVAAAVPLGDSAGQRTFWMIGVASLVRDQIQEAVRAAGGKLAGILHPGGLPYVMESPPPAMPVGRVEFWPSATVRVVPRDGELSKCRIDDSGAASAWFAAADAWRSESGASRATVLLADGEIPVDAAPDECASLADEELLRPWLAGWNRALAEKSPKVPVVGAAVRPLTKQQRTAIAGILGVVALGVCYAHTQYVASETAELAVKQARLAAPGQELAQIKQQITKLEADQKKALEESQKLEAEVRHVEEVFDAHRRRLADLLRRLADDSSHDWVLQKIEGTGAEIKLTGTTMHPEHISLLAEGMSTDLARHGWTVEPPMQTARNLADDGGPWKFELRLRDLNSLQPAAPTPTGTNPARSTIVGMP